MKVAASLYLLSPGSPFLYYGEEIGLRGSRGGSNTDANRRMAMLWGDGDTVRDPAGTTYTKQSTYTVRDLARIPTSLYNHYKQLILLRRANPEIARGEYTALQLEDTKAGGFIATWNGASVAVFHNTTINPVTIDLSVTGLSLTTLSGSAGEGEAVLEGQLLTLPGQTSAVIR
jgi:glycosidase